MGSLSRLPSVIYRELTLFKSWHMADSPQVTDAADAVRRYLDEHALGPVTDRDVLLAVAELLKNGR